MAKAVKKKETVKETGKGRPTKYRPQYADLAFNYCLLKASDNDLARFFDTSKRVIFNWKKKHPEFLDALRRGKEQADSRVAKSLFDRAVGYQHEDVDVHVYKDKIVKVKRVKHYPPDTAAAIFWLKNRQRDFWREKTETKVGLDENAVELIISALPPEIAAAVRQKLFNHKEK
jgi:hypothetical protein